MAALLEVSYDLASSAGIEQFLRSREQLAEHVALLRLERAVAAARAWRQLRAVTPAEAHELTTSDRLRDLADQYERLAGRPLASACPPRCSCRGAPESEQAIIAAGR
jgi:hypothetical protein